MSKRIFHAHFRNFETLIGSFLHPCSKVIGIYFVMSNDGIHFQCIDLKLSCCMMRSFVFIVENIMGVYYSGAPV